jgi:hypothetical protein
VTTRVTRILNFSPLLWSKLLHPEKILQIQTTLVFLTKENQMKKKISLLTLAILLILGLTFTTALAAGPNSSLVKKTDKPSIKATERALEKQELEKGKGKDKEKEKSKTPPGLVKTPKATHTPKAEKPEQKYLHLRGVIESASENSLELKTDRGTFSIAINADTRIHIPQEGDSSASAGLVAGEQASVKALEEPKGTYTAVQINVIPGKPARIHHVGTVSADNRAADGTLEITWKDGSTSTVKVTTATVFLPKGADSTSLVGKLVTVIAPRNLTGNDITATGIVVHPVKEQ